MHWQPLSPIPSVRLKPLSPASATLLEILTFSDVIQSEKKSKQTQTMELSMTTVFRVPGSWSSFYWKLREKLHPKPAWPIWHPPSIAPHWNHGTEQNCSLLLWSLCSWILIFCIDTLCPLQYSIKIQKQTVSKKQFQQAFTSPHPKILRTTAFKLLLNSEFSRTIHQ